MPEIDVAVVGGGIVGLAVARALLRARPGLGVVLFEKEESLGAHQTGRNSGVIHSGLYYKPGSYKARFAVQGAAAMERFAAEHGVPYERCGKVVVATREDELPLLAALHERGLENGVPNERLGAGQLHELEPHVAGLAALHVPSTGIIDYVGVCRALLDDIEAAGGEARFGTAVSDVSDRGPSVVVATGHDELTARYLVNCAGLHSDQVARLAGAELDLRIVPFRGEYFEVIPERRHLVRNLVYPVPDPSFPFLGVHFTRMVSGGLECGPNAVPALAREGYTWRDVDLRDLAGTLAWPGVWVLARKYWRTGLGEIHRSLSKKAFVRALQRLVPEVEEEDLYRAPAGVRAQALRHDGSLVDDFAIEDSGRVVHVLNAPSPAATASLLIGFEVAARLGQRLSR